MTRPIYRRCGDVLVLRAAVMPSRARPTDWPDIGSADACRQWLKRVWDDDTFVPSLRAASAHLVGYVDRILAGDGIEPKRIRKATCSVAGYLLRATGRPTPFGLFAGVALATTGAASAVIGQAHQAVARPDTLWVDSVRKDLEGRADVLPYLTIQVNSVAYRRGDTISSPRSGGRIASARISRPLSVLLRAAEEPVSCRELLRLLSQAGGTPEQARRLIGQALADGYLISNLTAPMTVGDPAGHIVSTLTPHRSGLEPETRDVPTQLDRAGRLLTMHNQAPGPAAHKLRQAADDVMRFAPAASRSRISLDLRLDARVSVPAHVLDEAEHAAHALVRLTRARGVSSAWAAYATHFWERYGAGVLVPVRDAVDLAAGTGFPADYPMSSWPQMPPRMLPRDEKLAAKAMHAAMTGTREIVLTDADIDDLADGAEAGPVAPHVELAIRIRSASPSAVDRGDFLLDVRPAWTAGALSGRFMALLGAGLSDLYPTLPTMVRGALPVQLSFTPTFPHGENVARIPRVLPHVLSVGEHRAPADHVIDVDDLAVFSTGRHLHLVSVSRRRVVEPVVLHPLALEKQAPPLARFLAMLGRGSVTAWTAFDWGPAAVALPFLPRIRYRRTILVPARWKLSAASLPSGPFTKEWHAALTEWAATWRCPARCELRDDDRTMSLDLAEPLHARLIHQHLQHHPEAVLAETVTDDDLGWIGHAHEITLPLAVAGPQMPHPDLTNAPVVTSQDLPGPGGAGWLQAKVFTHPMAMDQIITRRLPGLLEDLGTGNVWFVRYRSLQETDHLRIRVPAHDSALERVAAWTEQLTADRLASHLVIDGYRPETGRYGTGPAMEAAEAVFVADSLVTRYALTDLPRLQKEVLCALSTIDLAEGFLGTREAWAWMATTAPQGEGRPEITRPTVRQVRAHPLLTASPRLASALAERRATLGRYRALVGDERHERVLESLLHMHHNRMAGPDRASEAAARHAARQACRSLTVQGEA
ncbi:lantibiotic dehydratase [Streptomyces sp. NBC_00557]|uniref:lantibiotic dehydratase n=1 Tax=Streptomyces sp. NBC_00557 TaxID=2975776 RepID=UPI002E7FCA3C|nr:lantibiotic dehydratase [Streptomyces sp. NBC_00557]WUC39638.1 lantibiotic dehydratase [Streptomyces sp. NBC_00557]